MSSHRFQREAFVLRGRRRARGFTLLEVTIAVMIFAFAIVGLARALNGMIDAQLESRRLQHVRLELESRLAEARLDQLVEERRDLGEDRDGVAYVRETARIELTNLDNAPVDGVFRITIHAYFKDDEIDSAEIYVYENARL